MRKLLESLKRGGARPGEELAEDERKLEEQRKRVEHQYRRLEWLEQRVRVEQHQK